MYGEHRDLHSFPTRRSSDLGDGRSAGGRSWRSADRASVAEQETLQRRSFHRTHQATGGPGGRRLELGRTADLREPDRKSTRLNSSHVAISYAVFCLKKKNEWDNYIKKRMRESKSNILLIIRFIMA